MTCPVCGGKNDVVYSVKDCESIHRKRECKECGHIFYTAEYDAPSPDEFKRVMNEYNNRNKIARKKNET